MVSSLTLYSFTLVLMSCLQPVMSGLDATREIRHREALQIIPAQCIIALTANARPEQIELCLTVGMDDVMVRGIGSRSKGANWLLIYLPDKTIQAIGTIGTNALRCHRQDNSCSIACICPSIAYSHYEIVGGELCSCNLLSRLVKSRQFGFPWIVSRCN
jgi:CheY-like chemotaxis protein